MHGIALLALSIALCGDAVGVEKDVSEIQNREFHLPIEWDPAQKANIRHVVIYVSEDQGKTWKFHHTGKATDESVHFKAPRDGLYWFATQVILEDGRVNPVTADLVASRKVYVNTAHKTLKPRLSYEDLQQENEDLRHQLEQLKKRVGELEADRKGK